MKFNANFKFLSKEISAEIAKNLAMSYMIHFNKFNLSNMYQISYTEKNSIVPYPKNIKRNSVKEKYNDIP